jgi:hypothetical protein
MTRGGVKKAEEEKWGTSLEAPRLDAAAAVGCRIERRKLKKNHAVFTVDYSCNIKKFFILFNIQF